VLFHPDEAVVGAIRTVFDRFAEFGSARRVWLWFRHRLAYRDRSAGWLPLTPPSITSSRIRCMAAKLSRFSAMLALTPTAKPSVNATSMNTAPSRNACATSPWIGGRFSSRTIIRVLSIGPVLSIQVRASRAGYTGFALRLPLRSIRSPRLRQIHPDTSVLQLWISLEALRNTCGLITMWHDRVSRARNFGGAGGHTARCGSFEDGGMRRPRNTTCDRQDRGIRRRTKPSVIEFPSRR
jgi:hypothetical protein